MFPQKKCPNSDSCGHWRQEYTGNRARLESELSPQQVQRPASPSFGGLPREVEVGCGSQLGKENDS